MPKHAAPQQPRVGIVMGSDSDWPVMQAAADVLKQFEDSEVESICREMAAFPIDPASIRQAALAEFSNHGIHQRLRESLVHQLQAQLLLAVFSSGQIAHAGSLQRLP